MTVTPGGTMPTFSGAPPGRCPTPAQRELLAHCQACDGWLHGDPVRIQLVTVLAAERKGLVSVFRTRHGAIEGCTITPAGLAAFTYP